MNVPQFCLSVTYWKIPWLLSIFYDYNWAYYTYLCIGFCLDLCFKNVWKIPKIAIVRYYNTISVAINCQTVIKKDCDVLHFHQQWTDILVFLHAYQQGEVAFYYLIVDNIFYLFFIRWFVFLLLILKDYFYILDTSRLSGMHF